MSKVIFKYNLGSSIKRTVEMYSDAQILSIQEQNGMFVMWALVDTDNPLIEREFLTIGTGINFDPVYVDAINHGELQHLGTIQSGCLVYHFFENTMPF